jgi:hypothetical protein
VERGGAYRYYLEYFSSDACLSSNVVSIYVPEMPPEGGATDKEPVPQRAGLYVEVAGPDYVKKDDPFLVTARPSVGGGTVSWECITPSVGEVLLTQGRNAMLVGKSVTPGPIWRVSYTVEGATVHAYYRPYVIFIELVGGFSHHPWGPEDARRLREAKKRDAARQRHVDHMRTPDGVPELRKMIRFGFLGEGEMPATYLSTYLVPARQIGKYVVKEVGETAIPELHAVLRRESAALKRAHLAETITEIDEAFGLSRLWPEALDGGDVCVADYLSRHKYEDTCSPQVRQMLVRQLASGEEYLRILACRELARRKLVVAAPVLAELSRSDRSRLVRFWARHCVHCLERRVDPMSLHVPMSVSEIDEREVELARGVLAEMQDGLKAAEYSLIKPGSAGLRFRSFGSAAVPLIGARLCEADCTAREMYAFKAILRDVACDLPQRTREHFAEQLAAPRAEDRQAVFARYKQVVANTRGDAWRTLNLDKEVGRGRVDRLMQGGEPDQCYLVAGLAVYFEAMARRKPPRGTWIPFWAPEEEKKRLRSRDPLIRWRTALAAAAEWSNELKARNDLTGQLAAQFLTPPPAEAPKPSE